MYDLTGFQRDLLTVTAGLDEPHGLAIKDELENYYERDPPRSVVPEPDTLADKGLIEREKPIAGRTCTRSRAAESVRSKPGGGRISTSTIFSKQLRVGLRRSGSVRNYVRSW